MIQWYWYDKNAIVILLHFSCISVFSCVFKIMFDLNIKSDILQRKDEIDLINNSSKEDMCHFFCGEFVFFDIILIRTFIVEFDKFGISLLRYHGDLNCWKNDYYLGSIVFFSFPSFDSMGRDTFEEAFCVIPSSKVNLHFVDSHNGRVIDFSTCLLLLETQITLINAIINDQFLNILKIQKKKVRAKLFPYRICLRNHFKFHSLSLLWFMIYVS